MLKHVVRGWFAPIGLGIGLVTMANSGYADPPHACDYLSAEDVAGVVEAVTGPAERQEPNPLGQSICFFDLPSENKVRFVQLQLAMSSSSRLKDMGWTAATMFENNTGYLDEGTDIADLGERATWGGSGLKLGAGLHVLYRDAYFVVTVARGDEALNLNNAKTLAEIVIANIGR